MPFRSRYLAVAGTAPRRSLKGLAIRGCRKVSLTVTAANEEAIRLYERIGFHTTRTFGAYVWEGF